MRIASQCCLCCCLTFRVVLSHIFNSFPLLLSQRITKRHSQRFTSLKDSNFRKNTKYQRTCNMITSISNAELHETTAAGYREEVEHCWKSSPHSAPIRPIQGAAINTSTPSIQIPLKLLSCIPTNVMVMSKFCANAHYWHYCKCTVKHIYPFLGLVTSLTFIVCFWSM